MDKEKDVWIKWEYEKVASRLVMMINENEHELKMCTAEYMKIRIILAYQL